MSEGLAAWRLSRNQFKPVWAETVENYPARKLEFLSPQVQRSSMWHMKDNGRGYLFCKRVFIDLSPVKALEAVEARQKLPFFKYMSTIFFFGKTKFFESFFYHNTLPFEFYMILTYIWSIPLCKISQLQDSEMRPTGWTLSYRTITVLV